MPGSTNHGSAHISRTEFQGKRRQIAMAIDKSASSFRMILSNVDFHSHFINHKNNNIVLSCYAIEL